MKKKSILMIVENCFPGDPRVRKEAEVLKTHYRIVVIALKKMKWEKCYEVHNDITILRMPEFPSLQLGKVRYIMEYLYFTLCSAALFLGSHLFFRYKVIHVHNPPDTLFFVGSLGKIFGVKFVYDHHDLSPELYLTRFTDKKDLIYKTMIFFEKLSCKLANAIICTNESYKRIEMTRHGVKENKIFIVRNNPIIDECSLTNSRKNSSGNTIDKKILLFLGSINPQDGLDTLLHILHYLVNELNRKDFVCNIVGDGDSLDSLKTLASKLGLEAFVDFKGFVSDREKIREYLSSSDIGLEPAPENELNKHSTFIKIMEYMAAAKPIVAFDLVETRFSADSSAILIPPGDLGGFARAIQKLLDEPALRDELGRKGLQRVSQELTWGKASKNLNDAYKSIFPRDYN